MALPLPSTPPSGPSRAPLLPFGSTSPEDDWHDAISSPKLESFSRFVSEDSVTSINVLNMSELERSQTEPPLTPKSSLPSTPAAVSRAASPVGSGPSRMVSRWHRVSGYRTPSTASGFVRCWGGSERNSPRRPSYSMSPEERRLSVEGLDEQSRKQVEETKRNLESCIADMALQPISDLRLEKFRPLVTSLTRMERHFRRESPEALIGHLEPKVTVLNFILELHRAKRTPRPLIDSGSGRDRSQFYADEY
ncbi:unnamed protein product [Effrenium voratum]|nr:unnamed protein product [Effrenium voratum]